MTTCKPRTKGSRPALDLKKYGLLGATLFVVLAGCSQLEMVPFIANPTKTPAILDSPSPARNFVRLSRFGPGEKARPPPVLKEAIKHGISATPIGTAISVAAAVRHSLPNSGEHPALRTEDATDYESATAPDDLPWRCLLYTSPSPRDRTRSRMPSSA